MLIRTMNYIPTAKDPDNSILVDNCVHHRLLDTPAVVLGKNGKIISSATNHDILEIVK